MRYLSHARRILGINMSPRPSSSKITSSTSPPISTDYSPANYRAQKNEVGVFTTPPYSAYIGQYWRYKDEATAKKSAEEVWNVFQRFRDIGDFVGMDMSRKFIQMGRTRSLRYALRKGGRKYEQPDASTSSPKRESVKSDPDTVDLEVKTEEVEEEEDGATYQFKRATGERLKVIPRTGEVYDEGKLKGSEIFRSYEHRCWGDEVYLKAWEDWKTRQSIKPKSRRDKEGRGLDADKSGAGSIKDEVDEYANEKQQREEKPGPVAKKRRVESKADTKVRRGSRLQRSSRTRAG